MARTPASIRYKNPGAMWGSKIAKKWGAQDSVVLNDGLGQGNNIAVFPTYVQGICAQIDLWRSGRYKNRTLAAAIKTWCGNNNTESYIRFVLAKVPGIERDTRMDEDFWNGPLAVPFLKAQAWHEAGRKYPAPDADFEQALRIVLGKAKPSDDTVPLPKTKPMTKSKTLWSSIVAGASAVAGFLTDWKVLALLVVLAAIGYIIWERNGRPDIRGWFK